MIDWSFRFFRTTAKDHGLFLPHEDNKKGLWLDNARTLEHYILRNGVSLIDTCAFDITVN